jgi:hypothetical protein
MDRISWLFHKNYMTRTTNNMTSCLMLRCNINMMSMAHLMRMSSNLWLMSDLCHGKRKRKRKKISMKGYFYKGLVTYVSIFLKNFAKILIFSKSDYTRVYLANLRHYPGRVSWKHARKSNVWKSQVELHNPL